MWAQIAVAPLVQENTIDTVSLFHCLLLASSAKPPHRSTTVLPPTDRQTLAPNSSRLLKFSAKASRTGWNFGSQNPSMWLSAIASSMLCPSFTDRNRHGNAQRSPRSTSDLAVRNGAEKSLRQGAADRGPG